MARFNLFEGSRRVALLIKVLWVIGVGLFAYAQAPYVSMTLFTMMPGDPFVRIPGESCDSGIDDTEYITREFAPGRSTSLTLCFKAAKADSGAYIIPFKAEPNGRWWGNQKYTTDVMEYTAARARAFALTADDRMRANEIWGEKQSENFRTALLFVIGGWIVFSILQAVIGWTVRGFMGIPRGMDQRPQAAPQAETAV